MRGKQAQAYFSRIEPVLGSGLAEKRVAWLGLTACSPVIELLAGCRLRRFAWIDPAEQGADLINALRRHNHFEDGWEIGPFSPGALPDLLLAGGNSETLLKGLRMAQEWQIPALLFSPLPVESDHEAAIVVCRSGADLETERDFLSRLPEMAGELEADTVAQVAAIAKALLLRGTLYARPDYDWLFNNLNRTILLSGSPDWPWQVHYVGVRGWGSGVGERESGSKIILTNKTKSLELKTRNSELETRNSPIPNPQPRTPNPHFAVLGCGGLGSLIAKELNGGTVGRFSLVDGGKVQIFHPVRQFYHTSQLGRPKVYALAENLLGETNSISKIPARRGEPRIYQSDKTVAAYNLKLSENRVGQLERLVAGIRPDLAVITTGSELDFYLARALQRAGIPYLVARCYPRARYFEVIFSLPAEATPCFDCLRGHLYTGPHPGLTEEEQARYEVGRAVTLQAEPATLVETMRAAGVAARLGLEMLKPERTSWLQTLVAEGQNCLIGANETQLTPQGWAYGLSLPGQVAAYGLAQLFGNGSTRPCRTCGRVNRAVYHPV